MSAASAGTGGHEPLPFQDIGREEKRRFLLRAAAAAFGAKGFHAVTIRDIVERAGIAHGTFYLYFKSKEDVYDVLSRELQSHILEAIFPAGTAELPGDGAALEGLIRERLARLAQLFEREADFARVYSHRSPALGADLAAQRQRFSRDLVDSVTAVLRAGAERGVFRPHDPRVAALCLIGSIDRVIESWLDGRDERTGPSLRELMGEATGFFLAALLSTDSERTNDGGAAPPQGSERT